MALTNAQLVLSATQTAGDTLAGLHGWYQAHVATFSADVTLQRRIPKIGSTDATDWRDTAVIIEGTDFSDEIIFNRHFEYRFNTATAGSIVFISAALEAVRNQ